MQTTRSVSQNKPADRIEPPHPDDAQPEPLPPGDAVTGTTPPVRRDDKQPRDSDKPMLEKQPGTVPQKDGDEQPRSSDKVMTEQAPGSTA